MVRVALEALHKNESEKLASHVVLDPKNDWRVISYQLVIEDHTGKTTTTITFETTYGHATATFLPTSIKGKSQFEISGHQNQFTEEYHFKSTGKTTLRSSDFRLPAFGLKELKSERRFPIVMILIVSGALCVLAYLAVQWRKSNAS